MGKLLVVGSVALDTVQTPFGEATEVLGGSATYFAVAASYFTSVDLIAVVGEDFPDQHVKFLKGRGPLAKIPWATLTRLESPPSSLASPSLIISTSALSKTRHSASRLRSIQKFIVSHATSVGRLSC